MHWSGGFERRAPRVRCAPPGQAASWTHAPPLGEGVRWWNGFHDGDFIAGPVPGVDEDDPLGPGAHDRYELDEPVIDIVLGAAAGGQAGGP